MDCPYKKESAAERGFTLLEVLLVTVITGTMLGLTLVPIGALDGQKLDIAAAQAAEDIRLCQQLNLNGDGAYSLLFDCGRERYIVAKGLGVSAFKVVELPEGVDLVSTNFSSSRLEFRVDGKPRPYGGRLVLKNKAGKYLYVIVQTMTGRVRIDTSPP